MTFYDCVPAFAKELVKLGFGELRATADEKAAQHFAQPDWKAFNKNLRSKKFRAAVLHHPQTDEKLKKYVKNYGGFVTSKNEAARLKSKDSGKTYRIKELGNGRLACSCPDWKFKRSVGGGDCKHVRSLKQSRMLKKESGAFARGIGVGTTPVVALHLASRSRAKAKAVKMVTDQIVAEDRAKYGPQYG